MKRIIAFLTVIVFCCSFGQIYLSAEAAKYSEALPLPVLTGDLRNDFVAVAISQIGYKEASDGSTVYGAWNDAPYQDWCSEFTAWCAEKAGIPMLVFPKLTYCDAYRDYFTPRKRCFYLKEGVSRTKYDYMKDFDGTETISITELLPGDIILSGTGYPSTEPNHTGIFLSYKNGKAETVSGNINDSVDTDEEELDNIYAVIRPDFDLENTSLTKSINEVKCWGSTRADYTGKKVKPELTLYDKELGYYLTEGKDYTVKLKNAVNIGNNAKATYIGKGIYEGEFTREFVIGLKKPELSYSIGKTKLRLKWDKIPGAVKYVVYRSKDGGKHFTDVVTLGKDRDYSILKYNKNSEAVYYVRAYTKLKNGTWYSVNSNTISIKSK